MKTSKCIESEMKINILEKSYRISKRTCDGALTLKYQNEASYFLGHKSLK
jgi:hypothetical protein